MNDFEKDIRKLDGIPATHGAQGFVSTKSLVSLELTEWSLEKLLETVAIFNYKPNLLSMMTRSVEHFHSTIHAKQVLMSQLQYGREFMRSTKESLKRIFPWSAYYFTNRKGRCYPPIEDGIDFNNITSLLPKKTKYGTISKSNEEKLISWAESYTRAVRQRTVRQETTMAKSGTLPHYLYADSIDEMAKATAKFREKAIQIENTNATNEKDMEEDDGNNENSDEFDESEDDEEIIPVNDVAGLDDGALFMVGRSTRFGRAIKLNTKFFIE